MRSGDERDRRPVRDHFAQASPPWGECSPPMPHRIAIAGSASGNLAMSLSGRR